MNQDNQNQYLAQQNSPRNDRNMRSKSRLPSYRQNKPIYLTDGQFSSSDHTNMSSSQLNIFRIEYENKIKKLERQNKQLKQTIVSLKASQFYELDEQKIKNVIRQNQSLKLKILSLQSDMKLLDEQVSSLMVQNEYLKRNNKALKFDLQKSIKQFIRQKHNYYNPTTTANSKKPTNTPPLAYSDQYTQQIMQLKYESKQKQKEHINQKTQLTKLLNKKKLININTNNSDSLKQKDLINKQKYLENQQSLESEDKSKNMRNRNKSRYRSNSKSGEKGLVNPFLSNKGLMVKKIKKESDVPSTSQSQNLKHYSSSGNLNLRGQSRSRQLKMSTSRSPNPYELTNEYTSRRKVEGTTQVQSSQFKGQYFATKGQKYLTSRKKKGIYYN